MDCSFDIDTIAGSGLGGIVHALSDRPGYSDEQRETRATDTLNLIMSFLPRDAIDLTLCGQTVLFNEMLANSARDVMRGLVDTTKQKSLSGLVSMARVVQGNLDRLEKRGLVPARADLVAKEARPAVDVVQSAAGLTSVPDKPAPGHEPAPVSVDEPASAPELDPFAAQGHDHQADVPQRDDHQWADREEDDQRGDDRQGADRQEDGHQDDDSQGNDHEWDDQASLPSDATAARGDEDARHG